MPRSNDTVESDTDREHRRDTAQLQALRGKMATCEHAGHFLMLAAVAAILLSSNRNVFVAVVSAAGFVTAWWVELYTQTQKLTSAMREKRARLVVVADNEEDNDDVPRVQRKKVTRSPQQRQARELVILRDVDENEPTKPYKSAEE